MNNLPPADEVRETFRQDGHVVARGFLDRGAADDMAALATAVAGRSARHISRSTDEGTLDYRVVTGDVIKRDAAPIYALYQSAALLEWIRRVTASADVVRSPHLRSAININILDTKGQQYRWHHDAVPFSVLLFLTTMPPAGGGEFLIRTRPATVESIRPEAGTLVLMDGQRCAHAVAALQENALRISIPMVFPAVQLERPDGLDDYLYSTD